ncbi:hypothetical protein D3C78_403970 [compost metagenome]
MTIGGTSQPGGLGSRTGCGRVVTLRFGILTHGNGIVARGSRATTRGYCTCTGRVGRCSSGVGLEVLGALGDTRIQLIDVDCIGAIDTGIYVANSPFSTHAAYRHRVRLASDRTHAQRYRVVSSRLRIVAKGGTRQAGGLGSGADSRRVVALRLGILTHGNGIVARGGRSTTRGHSTCTGRLGRFSSGVGLEVLGALGDTRIQLIDVDCIGAIDTGIYVANSPFSTHAAYRHRVRLASDRTHAQRYRVVSSRLRIVAKGGTRQAGGLGSGADSRRVVALRLGILTHGNGIVARGNRATTRGHSTCTGRVGRCSSGVGLEVFGAFLVQGGQGVADIVVGLAELIAHAIPDIGYWVKALST